MSANITVEISPNDAPVSMEDRTTPGGSSSQRPGSTGRGLTPISVAGGATPILSPRHSRSPSLTNQEYTAPVVAPGSRLSIVEERIRSVSPRPFPPNSAPSSEGGEPQILIPDINPSSLWFRDESGQVRFLGPSQPKDHDGRPSIRKSSVSPTRRTSRMKIPPVKPSNVAPSAIPTLSRVVSPLIDSKSGANSPERQKSRKSSPRKSTAKTNTTGRGGLSSPARNQRKATITAVGGKRKPSKLDTNTNKKPDENIKRRSLASPKAKAMKMASAIHVTIGSHPDQPSPKKQAKPKIVNSAAPNNVPFNGGGWNTSTQIKKTAKPRDVIVPLLRLGDDDNTNDPSYMQPPPLFDMKRRKSRRPSIMPGFDVDQDQLGETMEKRNSLGVSPTNRRASIMLLEPPGEKDTLAPFSHLLNRRRSTFRPIPQAGQVIDVKALLATPPDKDQDKHFKDVPIILSPGANQTLTQLNSKTNAIKLQLGQQESENQGLLVAADGSTTTISEDGLIVESFNVPILTTVEEEAPQPNNADVSLVSSVSNSLSQLNIDGLEYTEYNPLLESFDANGSVNKSRFRHASMGTQTLSMSGGKLHHKKMKKLLAASHRPRGPQKPFIPQKGLYMQRHIFPNIMTEMYPLPTKGQLLFGPYEDELNEIEKRMGVEQRTEYHAPEKYMFPLHVYGKHSKQRIDTLNRLVAPVSTDSEDDVFQNSSYSFHVPRRFISDNELSCNTSRVTSFSSLLSSSLSSSLPHDILDESGRSSFGIGSRPVTSQSRSNSRRGSIKAPASFAANSISLARVDDTVEL